MKEQITFIVGGKSQCLFNVLTLDPTSVAIESTELEVVPYPPDLALSDFSLLAALKKHLRGVHFTCDKALQAAIGKWLREKPEKICSNGFKYLVQYWQCCVEQEAEYIGQWGIETKYTF
jgi:hypothetical protein